MNQKGREILEAAGWVVECESPLELAHADGSRATLQAASMLMDAAAGEQTESKRMKALRAIAGMSELLSAGDAEPSQAKVCFEVLRGLAESVLPDESGEDGQKDWQLGHTEDGGKSHVIYDMNEDGPDCASITVKGEGAKHVALKVAALLNAA